MQRNPKNQNLHRVAGRIAAERKKMAIALCLIGLMVFMWVRVLGKKGPANAEASFGLESANISQSVRQVKISFIELPHIESRHDSLARDFFTIENWRDFTSRQSGFEDSGEVNQISKNNFDDISKFINEKLKVDIIEMGTVPQAFIGGKLVMAGGKIEVSDGNKKYECEITKIEKNTVYLKCGNSQIQLKLQAAEESTYK